MSALEQAYASNAATPLLTLEFSHSALTGGVLRLVQAYYDLTATLEDSTSVTFTSAALNINVPERSTEGLQDLEIAVDNTDNTAWTQLKAVIDANRTTEEKVICKFRNFLESDLTAPAGAIITLTVLSSSVIRESATFRASYTPLPDTSYPRLRYYPTEFPGIKYV